MGADRTRSLWREPVLIGAVLVLAVAVVTVGVFGYDALTQPVLQSPTDADGVPTELPHGESLPEVPEALEGVFERPVVLVGAVEYPLRDLERCAGQVEWAFAPTVRASQVTPEGLTVALRGEEQGTGVLFQVTCYAVWAGRTWDSWATWIAEAPDPHQSVRQPEPACCRDDGLALRGGELETPEGTAWVAQDRGPYWLIFPVDESGLAHIVWPVPGDDPAPPPTVYLDASGNPLEPEAVPDPPPQEPEPEEPAPEPEPEEPAPEPET